ncbi:adaptin N terminal region-domain containing protein [Nitzschia inconspicua]|uniref:AP-2 complex subunit alpha n=1 Tax=Nitzschia inconspicua TaxID=303405 RepID=A0A9K3LSG0_9STRA|nr:adaptin N terminal region-domain containing protein [Nitzschia inconspicua]
MATGGINLSKEFFELLKAIGESKSKQEEDRIIAKEVQCLKQKLEPTPPGVNPPLQSKKRAKEFLVRLLYVEMLGHDASFGYIKAVEMAASASLYHKRTGYLVCSACLSPEHEFRFMLVNQMQRDLQSANVLEICGGLLASTALITSDMVPAMSGEVTKLITHDSETVRKKAIITLHRFYELAPDVVTFDELYEKVRKVLCDRDPAVMGSVLNVIEEMAKEDPTKFKDLIPSLVSILKQIGEHRLPNDFDYHRVPAPWMQIRLIRILSLLGQGDAASSSGMYEILFDTMKKADVGINAGYAIVYECIKCITKIYPNAKLLDAAADAISRFIESRSHNLKYLGVTGLAMIVETHPQYAAQHQMSVMDCLEDPDETLQRKTLDLLYRMTNPVNVEFITDKLLDFLRGTTDLFLKQQLTTRVCSVAERYAPSNAWYIKTITQLFEVSGDMVKPEVAQNLMSLIAEGTGESDEADMLLRQTAIDLYVQLLQEKPPAKLPKILLETMAWCLGEYAYLSAALSLEDILAKLCHWNKAALQPSTRKFLTSAIFKLVAQAGTCPKQAAEVVDEYTRSKDVDLQQRCLEFQALLTTAPQYLGEILPVDASAEDVEVDVNLSFLDGFCQQALANGARAYEKPEDDDDDEEDYGAAGAASSAFKMTPYAKPETNINRSAMLARGMGTGGQPAGISLPPGSISGNQAVVSTSVDVVGDGLSLNTRGVANVWGKKPGALPAAPPPAAAPAPAAVAPSTFDSSATANVGGFGGPSSNAFGTASYGGAAYGQAPASVLTKTPEQLEKERMAAALFGGIVPGAAPPPAFAPPAPMAPPRQTVAAPPVAAPPVAAPPVTLAPAPAEEVDLLDLGAFDVAAPAPALANDVFGSSTLEPATATAPPIVETVSENEDVLPAPAPVQQATIDPFAAEGLLGDLSETPLQGFGILSSKYEYNGSVMAPMKIVTAQFGQQWGSCTATSPVSVTSRKVTFLNDFMKQCEEAGLHPVEAIGATNEGICAGIVEGGSKVVLVHGKLSPMGSGAAKIDITVKSTDSTLSGSLALYLQNMMK